MSTTALFTDRYELTMLGAALRDSTASRRCSFEVFARRLPDGRRYGVVGGTARVLDAIVDFRLTGEDVAYLREDGVIDETAADYLASFRFGGDVDGYPEGELYFPQSPIMTVSGTFAEAVVLETLVLSILNHDSAIAAAAARMVAAAAGRPVIEMGSRRTHERAAVAAARAAYLAGFASTSNLAAGQRYGIPTAGTAAHSFTLLHDDERAAFAAQTASVGTSTTLLVDTYDITRGIATAVEVAGPQLGAVRIDSGDLGVLARLAREQLDSLGATGTRIVVSGDLDEFAIAALAAAPVDAYGAGTAVVVGSGAPTAGLVYKLVEVDGHPVAKRSEHKASAGGRKTALRAYKPSGTALEEIVARGTPEPHEGERFLQRPLMRAGEAVAGLPSLDESREHLRAATITLPWDGLKLSRGEPAIPTRLV
ncbi:MAG: nicotinate phosphoribosyltransferase [Actinomycetota bacterium]|nr:nicotinate phosphoribosyltransferase [Actinomycetota bacterium]